MSEGFVKVQVKTVKKFQKAYDELMEEVRLNG
jgi:hypothetical protein